MTTVKDIVKYVESRTGHCLNCDEGVHFGESDKEVRIALICWMATRGAIETAGRAKADLLITHESLYFPYDGAVREDNPSGWQLPCWEF